MKNTKHKINYKLIKTTIATKSKIKHNLKEIK